MKKTEVIGFCQLRIGRERYFWHAISFQNKHVDCKHGGLLLLQVKISKTKFAGKRGNMNASCSSGFIVTKINAHIFISMAHTKSSRISLECWLGNGVLKLKIIQMFQSLKSGQPETLSYL